jgi:hypothetical protein
MVEVGCVVEAYRMPLVGEEREDERGKRKRVTVWTVTL